MISIIHRDQWDAQQLLLKCCVPVPPEGAVSVSREYMHDRAGRARFLAVDAHVTSPITQQSVQLLLHDKTVGRCVVFKDITVCMTFKVMQS